VVTVTFSCRANYDIILATYTGNRFGRPADKAFGGKKPVILQSWKKYPERLLLILSLLALVSVFFWAAAWSRQFQAEQEQALLGEVRNAAEKTANVVEAELIGRARNILHIVALAEELQNEDSAQAFLAEIFPALPGIEDILAADSGGRVYAQVKKESQPLFTVAARPYYQQTREQNRGIVSNALESALIHQPVIAITEPLKEGSRFKGLLAVIVRTSELADFLEKDDQLRNRVYLFDGEGQLLAHAGNVKGLDPAVLYGAVRGLAGPSSLVEIGEARYFVGSASIEGSGWQVLVAVPYAEAVNSGIASFLTLPGRVVLAVLLTLLFLSFAAVYGLRRQQLELVALAETDDLTSLYNQRAFARNWTRVVQQALARGGPAAVLMLDMNDFKQYNDTYGHEAGNQRLRQVAQTIKECIREQDLACRYGGDEMTVILPGAGETEARLVAERIRARLKANLNEENVTSIGWAVLPDDGTDAQKLLVLADHRMYRDKEETAGKQP